ncbi:sulfatase-like hydrolase/transferase [Micromonospora sp. NPDC003241]
MIDAVDQSRHAGPKDRSTVGEQPYDHIVFVSIDTLRGDAIAANPLNLWRRRFPDLAAPPTAVLDDLVGRGAFFPNTITAAPYTAAAHGALLTGRYPLHNGLHEFYNGRLRAPSIFTHGRRVGKQTIMKVDFPIILGPELGFTPDVDVYLDEDDGAFVDAVAASEGCVALAHFGGVHIPYGFHNLRFGGQAFRDKVDELEAMLPAEKPAFVDRLVESHRDPEDAELLFRYKRAAGHLYETGAYDLLMRLYLDGVAHFLTTRLEPFLDRLTRRVAAAGRRMLLVVFSDHGEEFDEHTNGHFNSMAEAVLRVPVVLVGDGVAAGLHRDRIRTVDIVPTVLDLAGLRPDPDDALDGRSLADAARGTGGPPPDAEALAEAYTSDLGEFIAFQERQRAGEAQGPLRHVLVGQAAYQGRHRLVRVPRRYRKSYAGIDEVQTAWVERFDDDLVPHVDPTADDRDLRALLDAYTLARTTPEPVPATVDIRAQLRSLGYAI